MTTCPPDVHLRTQQHQATLLCAIAAQLVLCRRAKAILVKPLFWRHRGPASHLLDCCDCVVFGDPQHRSVGGANSTNHGHKMGWNGMRLLLLFTTTSTLIAKFCSRTRWISPFSKKKCHAQPPPWRRVVSPDLHKATHSLQLVTSDKCSTKTTFDASCECDKTKGTLRRATIPWRDPLLPLRAAARRWLRLAKYGCCYLCARR